LCFLLLTHCGLEEKQNPNRKKDQLKEYNNDSIQLQNFTLRYVMIIEAICNQLVEKIDINMPFVKQKEMAKQIVAMHISQIDTSVLINFGVLIPNIIDPETNTSCFVSRPANVNVFDSLYMHFHSLTDSLRVKNFGKNKTKANIEISFYLLTHLEKNDTNAKYGICITPTRDYWISESRKSLLPMLFNLRMRLPPEYDAYMNKLLERYNEERE
jgi:hypothetical protein